MYISIGNDIVIKSNELIAILDQHVILESEMMREFLEKAKLDLNEADMNKSKSIVITSDQIYFSPFSSSTLIKRSPS